MTTRMLTIISGAPLPNYIAINELVPDVVHCLYTPNHGGMKEKLKNLQTVVKRNLPDIRFEEHAIDNQYDSRGVYKTTVELLQKYQGQDEDWILNRSAGTEQMRSPLVAAFDAEYHDAMRGFFVETDANRISQIDENWDATHHPFTQDIRIEDYFALHGQKVKVDGTAQSSFEQRLLSEMQRLDFFDVRANCRWLGNNEPLAEYDALGIYKYKLFTFEVKQMEKTKTEDLVDEFRNSDFVYDKRTKEIKHKDKNKILVHDIEKLAYTRSIFGGPTGKAYWLMNGNFEPSDAIKERMRRLNIEYRIGGYTVAKQLADAPDKYGLPPIKEKPPKK